MVPTDNPTSEHPVESTLCAALSLLGNRDSQQDAIGCWDSEYAQLAIVADGAGGHVGGARAARIAVEQLHKTWQDSLCNGVDPKEAADILCAALLEAHATIIREGGGKASLSGKAAVVVLYTCDGQYTAVNIGDCRAYMARKKQWELLTKDDSLLRILIDQGEVAPEEARNHPDQCILTQALGASSNIKPHVKQGAYSSDSTFILCCDGFWNQLPENLWEMPHWRVDSPKQQQEVLHGLALEAIQDANGSSDNVSAVWLHARKAPKATATAGNRPPTNLLLIFAILVITTFALITFFIMKWNSNKPVITPLPTTTTTSTEDTTVGKTVTPGESTSGGNETTDDNTREEPSETAGPTDEEEPSTTEGQTDTEETSETAGPAVTEETSSTEGQTDTEEPSETEGQTDTEEPSSTEELADEEEPSTTEGQTDTEETSTTEGQTDTEETSETEGQTDTEETTTTTESDSTTEGEPTDEESDSQSLLSTGNRTSCTQIIYEHGRLTVSVSREESGCDGTGAQMRPVAKLRAHHARALGAGTQMRASAPVRASIIRPVDSESRESFCCPAHRVHSVFRLKIFYH